MRKDRCRKCGSFTFVFKHHPLPQATFGKGKNNQDSDTVNLCGTCHTDYHEYLGKSNLKNPDSKFHYQKWYTWLYMLCFIGLITLLIACL